MKKCIALLFSIIVLPFVLNAYTTKFYTFQKEGDKRLVMIGGCHESSSIPQEQQKLEAFHSGFFQEIDRLYGARAVVFTEALHDLKPEIAKLLEQDPKKENTSANRLLCGHLSFDGLTLGLLHFNGCIFGFKKITFDDRKDSVKEVFDTRLKAVKENMRMKLNQMPEEVRKDVHSVTQQFITMKQQSDFYKTEDGTILMMEGLAADYNLLIHLQDQEKDQNNALFIIVAGQAHVDHQASLVEKFGWTIIDKHDSTNPVDWKTEDPLLKPLLPSLCAEKSCANKGSKKCGQCDARAYCSKECQISDWKSGHKEVCRPNPSLKVPAATSADKSTSAAPIGLTPQSGNPGYSLYGLKFLPLGLGLYSDFPQKPESPQNSKYDEVD